MENLNDIIMSGFSGYDFGHLYRHLIIVSGLILLSGVFSVADMVSGIYTAKKLHEPLRSHRYRNTVEKMAVYWFFQILVGLVGLVLALFEWYQMPYLSIALALGICLIEGISMFEHSKRRRDHMAKLPETLQAAIDFLGDEDDIRNILKEILKRKMLEKGGTA